MSTNPTSAWELLNDEAFYSALAKARRAWLDAMRDYRTSRGSVRMPLAPALTEEHVANCVVMASRDQILEVMPKRGTVAEVGVLAGDFSAKILDIVQPSAFHLFDKDFQTHAVLERFAPQVDDGTMHLHEGISWESVPKLPDGLCDFIYIDADHTYAAVKRDLEVAKHKIKQNGFLLFNDYIYLSPKSCRKYGVVEAVNELCVNEGWELAYFALHRRMYCDVAIRRMNS